ncbi:MAG: iron-containing alcohol dehydrogenase [Candidatus Nanoarchaeia archaeon]
MPHWLNILSDITSLFFKKENPPKRERWISIPPIVYGCDTIKKTKEYCKERHLDISNVVILTGPKTKNFWPEGTFEREILFEKQNFSYSNLKEKLKEIKPSLLIGLGGGSNLDLTKIVATELNIPFVLIPTAISNDGVAANFAKKDSRSSTIPVAQAAFILADYNVLKQAGELNSSGLGDILSNYNAANDWLIATKKLGDDKTNFSNTIYTFSKQISQFCLKLAEKKNSVNEFVENLFLCAVSSGALMNSIGSSIPCSGAEHTLEKIIETNTHLHGHKVASFSLPLLTLWDYSVAKKYYKILKKFKMPTHVNEFEISEKDFLDSAKQALSYRTPQDLSKFNYKEHRYTILNRLYDFYYNKNPKTAEEKFFKKLYNASKKINFF